MYLSAPGGSSGGGSDKDKSKREGKERSGIFRMKMPEYIKRNGMNGNKCEFREQQKGQEGQACT